METGKPKTYINEHPLHSDKTGVEYLPSESLSSRFSLIIAEFKGGSSWDGIYATI